MTTDPLSLDRAESLALLRRSPVGRIIYTANALPAVQPVNYTLDGDTITITTHNTPGLATGGRHDIVAFEVDDIDPIHGTGWTVLITGRTHEITPLAGAPAGTRYLRISCDIVSGQRLRSNFAG